MSFWLQILIGVIVLTGAILIFDTGIAMNRARDSITRVNMVSPAVYVGFPLVVLGLLLTDFGLNGFNWVHLLEFILLILGLPVASAMGSMQLGRAMMLTQTRVDPRTVREDLRLIGPVEEHPQVGLHDSPSRYPTEGELQWEIPDNVDEDTMDSDNSDDK
ncbi:MAG TPA: hypothetical protein GX530_05795 [Corynebacteriales bacterium]|nr:hypothetical protein [Mycobacteriales bacterium]